MSRVYPSDLLEAEEWDRENTKQAIAQGYLSADFDVEGYVARSRATRQEKIDSGEWVLMSRDRFCSICNKLLSSGTTRVVGDFDFCSKHGSEVQNMVNMFVSEKVEELKDRYNTGEKDDKD